MLFTPLSRYFEVDIVLLLLAYTIFKVTGQSTVARPSTIAPPSSEITPLSATIVVLQHDQILDQQVIPTLVISSEYITLRHDVASIMLSSLLHLITQTTPTNPTFSQTLHSVLSGGNSHIGVATARVPAFAGVGQLKSPEYGYRQLGNIPGQIPFQLLPVPYTLDQQNEVFAADPDHVKSQDYSRIWRMFGLKMDKHFILVFNIPQNHPSASLSNSPASRSSPFGGLSPHPETSGSLVSFLHQAETQPQLQHASPAESYLPSTGGVYYKFSLVYHLH